MAVKIVFCYAHEDEGLLDELKAHLRLLEREQIIEMWYDRNITGGQEWRRKISEKLDTADIILLLVSAYFMDSDYCYSVEMQRALELHKQGKACVIPVILRPVLWQATPLGDLQSLPTDGHPVTDMQHWKTSHDAFFKVTQGICLVLQQLVTRPATAKLLNADLLHKVLAEHGLLLPTREKYRIFLHRDARIAKVQIMSMSRPLDISSIYVRVRVHHEEVRLGLDPILQTAARMRDPNMLLEAKREQLKRRAGEALEPDAAIVKYPRCVIVGDPGAGKTTLLKYLALKSVDGTLANLPDLPIHIELNAFVSSKSADLLEFAAYTWHKRYGFARDEALTFLRNELRAGRAMLLLDALDETVIGESSQEAEASYKRVADMIVTVATRYDQVPIVVTARKAGYQLREPLADFIELEVLDFSFDDIERFITNWFNNSSTSSTQAGSEQAQDLIAKLERALRIRELATNPLLLSLIVLVYESERDLPERRATLYERCIYILLTEWDSRRNKQRRREFSLEHKRQILEEIAWHFHQQGARYFAEHELLEVIARFLPAVGLSRGENRRLLAEIANENGILKEQAQGWYGFIHMTLQEYCAARYLIENGELDTLMQYVDDPRWEEVVLLYAGGARDASPLLERLLGKAPNAPSDDIFHNNLILAGRCLTARPTIRRVALREEVLDSLITLIKTTPYSLTIKQVIEALLELGEATVKERLLGLLKGETIVYASEFIKLLWELGKRTLEPDLLRMIQDEQCGPDLRCGIIKNIPSETLGRAIPDLLSLLKNKQCDLSVRIAIADLCRDNYWRESINTAYVKSELWDIVRGEPHDTIVYGAILLALESLKETVSMPTLFPFLTGWSDLPVTERENVFRTAVSLDESTVVPELMSSLGDEQLDDNLRKKIIGDLVSELLSLLRDEQLDVYFRMGIASTLLGVEEEAELLIGPALLSLLKDKQLNLFLRESIASTLGGRFSNILEEWRWEAAEMSPAEIAGPAELLSLLKDKQLDISLRSKVVLSLTEPLRAEVTQGLLSMLKSEPHGTILYNSLVLVIAIQKESTVSQDLLLLLKERRYPPGFLTYSSYSSDSPAIDILKDQKYVPDLLALLTDWQQPFYLRFAVANMLEGLIDDDETTAQLSSYVPRLYIDGAIYDSLWRLSRRTGVRIPAGV